MINEVISTDFSGLCPEKVRVYFTPNDIGGEMGVVLPEDVSIECEPNCTGPVNHETGKWIFKTLVQECPVHLNSIAKS